MTRATLRLLGLAFSLGLAACSHSHSTSPPARDGGADSADAGARSADAAPSIDAGASVYDARRPPGAWDADDPRCYTGGRCRDPIDGSRYCCSSDRREIIDGGVVVFCGDGPPCINEFYCCADTAAACPETVVTRCYDGELADGCGFLDTDPVGGYPTDPGYCDRLPRALPDASVMR